jgi:GT2 family glycosyltransferase
MTIAPAQATEPEGPRVQRGARVPDAPSVSIIVLVTTSTDRLQRCLASMEAGVEGGPVAEIIVLANGTAPEALKPIAGRDDIVLIRSAVNHGFGGGCNWAARFACGARLVFINDDAVADAGWLAALDSAMSEDARVGVVGGRVLLESGRLQEAGNVVWRDGSTSHIGRGLPADQQPLLARRDVDYVSFCSAMIRRETWVQVGGFDERYFPAYYEDADLCLSARALGWRVVCEPASVVLHDEGASTPVALRHFLSARNQGLFVAKWRSTLAEYDERPKHVTPAAVMQAAAHTPVQAVAAAGMHEHAPDAATPISRARRKPRNRAGSPPAEADRLALEARHLAADVALKNEYATNLAAQLEAYGTAALLRKRYVSLRRALGVQVRRRPGVARAVERLRSRLGDRE